MPEGFGFLLSDIIIVIGLTGADSHKQQSNEQMDRSERWACQISKCQKNNLNTEEILIFTKNVM